MLFDAHGDILTDIYEQVKKGNINTFKKRHLENYLKAGITHSIFVNWTNPATKNLNEFEEIFEAALTEIRFNEDIIKICLNHSDMLKATDENKLGVILGIEGIAQLKGLDQLKDLYDKGIRHAGLTWNEVNNYASGLDDLNTRGLTNEGIQIVKEMESLGMLIDLAHLNEKSFEDVIRNTKRPVIISHGNAKALCSHRRNYTDKQLLQIKNKNGVVGVCGIPPFISHNEDEHTVSFMAKHIDYIVKLIGIDHVGLGIDMCYFLFDNRSNNKVKGLETIADVPNIIIELEKLGYSKEDISKIKYKNFFRVIKEILG